VLGCAACAAGLLAAAAGPSPSEAETLPGPVPEDYAAAEDTADDAAAAGPLPDWGTPPADEWDAGEEWPPLPQARGWARFQGMGWAFNWWEVLAVGGGVVVMHDYGHEPGGTRLAAYNLADGHSVWETKLAAFDQYADKLQFDDSLIYSYSEQGPGIGALQLSSGKQLWTRAGLRPLAAGKAGVWVATLGAARPAQ
jgi:hypothetical protein